ncbi:MAG: DUF6056 family protein, partial [Elusimicrobiota bacterium]|nr:DUF6056 family protein [Elusimicrobiota bacterium]
MRAVKTNYAVVMVWGLTIFIYLAFIALLSALYPYGFDEYQGLSDSLKSAFKIFWHTHTSFQPRIGGLFGSIILYLGKWSFVLLNPLAQISLVFSYFYFIFLRMPDFKALKDLSVFLLLCLLSFLAVPIPAETVFWIGGANNYSWTMLIFMIMLCALRAAAEGKDFIGKKRFNLFIFAVVGLFLGMSNENNAPMALVIFALSFAYFKIKKIQIPKWYYFALLGIIVGLIILFFSGGTLKRAADWNFEYFFKASVLTKMFFHLNNMHDYFAAVLLPLITPILIFLVFVDGGGG